MPKKPNCANYINTFICDATPLDPEVIHLPETIYDKVLQFGELTFGNSEKASIFTAIKILAKECLEVREALCFTSTEIGKLIDNTIIENPHDPWFNTILLYRPDMLISKSHQVYTNELEIVVGGIGSISLLQNYVYGEHKLINSLIENMRSCQKKFKLTGKIAFLFDQNGAALIQNLHWLTDFGDDILVGNISQLSFKADGVYLAGEKIALAQVFIKAHKGRENIQKHDVKLLEYWLEKKILLFSPPTLTMDNKIIMLLLQHPNYKKRLEELLGAKRYEQINSYLPKTYLLTEHRQFQSNALQAIIDSPWEHGKFIVKYPTLWSSQKMIVSPNTEKEKTTWKQDLQYMLNNVKHYGPLIIQEMIDVMRMPFKHAERTIIGKTKFNPFFIHDPITDAVTTEAFSVNICAEDFVHITEEGRFGLVEKIATTA